MIATEQRNETLRSGIAHNDGSIGVDREKNVLRGFVVAEAGPFKTEGRGQFTIDSLKRIVVLGNQSRKGLRSRFQHPNLMNDGLGKFLGRVKSFRLDGDKVRADLHFNPTALETPPEGGKPYGIYVMDLATSDPNALSSSLVLSAERAPAGAGEPEVWLPTKLNASDIVDQGEAVGGIFGGMLAFSETGTAADQLDQMMLVASPMLDRMFRGQSREVIESRMNGFFANYLNYRWPNAKPTKPARKIDAAAKQMLRSLGESIEKRVKHIEAEARTELQKCERGIAKAKRASAIAALCAMAGAGHRAQEFIAQASLSVSDVRATLFKGVWQKSPPPADDAASERLGSSHPDPDRELRREYQEQRKVHEALGITEQRYIDRRRKEIAASKDQPKR